MNNELLKETFAQIDLSEEKTGVVCFNLVLRTCYIMMINHWDLVPDIDAPEKITNEMPDLILMASAVYDIIDEEANLEAKKNKKPVEPILLKFAIKFSYNTLDKNDPAFVSDFYKGISKFKRKK